MSRIRVFDQVDEHNVHPYEPILQTILQGSNVVEERAVARNLSYDHRVPRNRAKQLHQEFSRLIAQRRSRPGSSAAQPTWGDLSGAMKDYFSDRIGTKPDPEFASRKLNSKNLLKSPGREPHQGTPDEGEWLVNVLDLNGLFKVYENAATAAKDELGIYSKWRNVFAGLDNKSVDAWLDDELEFDEDAPLAPLVATDKQKEFVSDILEALKVHQQGWPGQDPNYYQPVWAAIWNEFLRATGWSPDIVSEAQSWLEVVGIPKDKPGRWLILLVYPVRDVQTLARPTILDGRPSPWHFPSPPCAPLTVGGHPVDLGKNYRAGAPISEFIHTQIEFKPEYWESSGYAIARTTSKVGIDLAGERRVHRDQLDLRYLEGLGKDWMQDTC